MRAARRGRENGLVPLLLESRDRSTIIIERQRRSKQLTYKSHSVMKNINFRKVGKFLFLKDANENAPQIENINPTESPKLLTSEILKNLNPSRFKTKIPHR